MIHNLRGAFVQSIVLHRVPTPWMPVECLAMQPPHPEDARTKSILCFSMVSALACVVVTLAAGIRAHRLALPDEAGRNDSVRWRVRSRQAAIERRIG